MKQHHRPPLIMRAGGFQTESVKNHTDYRKVSRFEQNRHRQIPFCCFLFTADRNNSTLCCK